MIAPTPQKPDSQERGEESRERIRAAIRRRRALGQRWPILDEIVADTGLAKTTVRWHISWMKRQAPPQVEIAAARREIILLDEARP